MADLTADNLEKEDAAEHGTQEVYPFRFVEVGRPSQARDEDRRSAIRSHVMRDFYEKRGKRKRPNTQPEINSAASVKEGASQQINRFKISAHGLQEVKRKRNKRAKDLQVIGTSTDGGSAHPKARKAPNSRQNLKPLRPVQPIQADNRQPPLLPDNRSQPRENATSANVSTTTSISPNSNFRLALRSSPPADQKPGQPQYSPGSGAVDPFDSLPICGQQTQVLLYYAHRTILAARIMGQVRTDWLELATQSMDLYYLALSHYAGNYGLAKDQSDPVEAVRFRSEAIKIVNEKLGNMSTALEDSTVNTVASLSSYEATNGPPEGIRTHLEGLQRLVALKGGLRNFRNPAGRRLILWADLNCANALGTDPIISLSESREDLEPWASTTETTASKPPESGSTNNSPSEIELLSREMRDNFTSLKELALIDAEIGSSGKPPKEEAIRYSDKLYLTERSLLTLANKCGPHKFVTCGCLAAIIYLDNQFRGISFKAEIMHKLLARLRNSMASVLENTSRRSRDDNIARAILWVLFVGALAAAKNPEQEWFIEEILTFLKNLNANSWEEVEEVLKGFLWPPAWENGSHTLWTQIRERLLFQSTVLSSQDTEGDPVDTEAEGESRNEVEERDLEFGASD